MPPTPTPTTQRELVDEGVQLALQRAGTSPKNEIPTLKLCPLNENRYSHRYILSGDGVGAGVCSVTVMMGFGTGILSVFNGYG